MASIFLIDGMSFGISGLSISFTEDGQATSEGLTTTIAYDACIVWAKIALEHRETALINMEERKSVWSAVEIDSERRASSLEAEFHATMQAVVAAVTCIDALYDHLLPHSPVPDETRKAWSKNKLARQKQIAETIKATFALKPSETSKLIETLNAMFTLRNAAIHPSNSLQPPYAHPELDILTDWRLTAFRGDVADSFVCHAVGILWEITRGTKYRSTELTKFIAQLKKRVDSLLPEGKPVPSKYSVNIKIPN